VLTSGIIVAVWVGVSLLAWALEELTVALFPEELFHAEDDRLYERSRRRPPVVLGVDRARLDQRLRDTDGHAAAVSRVRPPDAGVGHQRRERDRDF
jgi:hypothetical protein